ncbi:MAG: DinB superfamily protein [Phycisphaerales bacterium]|nr:DinB superfamily protein [Phycisphaerales bacterium]
MTDVRGAIVSALANSQFMLDRFIADLTPAEYLHRPTPKANCPAWTVGHLILTDRRTAARFGAEMPGLPEGFEQRFARDEHAPAAADYGDVSGLRALFNETRGRLIDVVKRATPEVLNQPLENVHPRFKTVGEMALFMAIHTSMHAGQITIIRRCLGRPPLI